MDNDNGQVEDKVRVKVLRMTPELLAEEMRKLEEKHGMSSAEFYRRFLSGDMPEHLDFFRWVWLCTVAIGRGVLSLSPTHS